MNNSRHTKGKEQQGVAKSKTNTLCFAIGNVVVPLFLGIALYIFTRPDSYFSMILHRILNIRIPHQLLLDINNSFWLSGIKNHLADFLWAYSFAVCVMLAGHKTIFSELQLAVLCCFIATALEISQLINPFFTFDFFDILTEVIGIIAGWFFYQRHNYKTEKRKIKHEPKS